MLIIHRKSIMLMHRPQTPQPGFDSVTLLQKFTPHFKILDPRLNFLNLIRYFFFQQTKEIKFELEVLNTV